MPGYKSESPIAVLAGIAAERRKRLVDGDAIIAEILSRPLLGGEPPAVSAARSSRPAFLQDGGVLTMGSGLEASLGENWHAPQGAWGCWTSSERAELRLELAPNFDLPAAVRLDIVCLMPRAGSQKVMISTFARRLVEQEFHQDQEASLDLMIDPRDLSGRRLDLFIDVASLIDESDVPGSRSARALGIALRRIRLGETGLQWPGSAPSSCA